MDAPRTRAPRSGAERLAEPMRSRWSPSVYDATHLLEREEVELLLTAAQWAPSAGNRQPWRYGVAPRGSVAHKQIVPALSRGNSGWAPRASLLLVAVAEVGDGDPTYPLFGLGQATAHLTLQAHAMGLHAHQFAGFDREAVAEVFGVPATHRVVAGIAVGRHAAGSDSVGRAEVDPRDAEREHRPRARKTLEEISFGEAWDTGW